MPHQAGPAASSCAKPRAQEGSSQLPAPSSCPRAQRSERFLSILSKDCSHRDRRALSHQDSFSRGRCFFIPRRDLLRRCRGCSLSIPRARGCGCLGCCQPVAALSIRATRWAPSPCCAWLQKHRLVAFTREKGKNKGEMRKGIIASGTETSPQPSAGAA